MCLGVVISCSRVVLLRDVLVARCCCLCSVARCCLVFSCVVIHVFVCAVNVVVDVI